MNLRGYVSQADHSRFGKGFLLSRTWPLDWRNVWWGNFVKKNEMFNWASAGYWTIWLKLSEIVVFSYKWTETLLRRMDGEQFLLWTSKWKYVSQAKATEGCPYPCASIQVSHKTQKILHIWQRSGFWPILCSIFYFSKYHVSWVNQKTSASSVHYLRLSALGRKKCAHTSTFIHFISMCLCMHICMYVYS